LIVPNCQTKSESAISRFLNYYNWSTRSLIRTIRSYILNLILAQRIKGRKPIVQVILDLTTLEKVGKFPHLKDLIRVYNHKRWQIEGFFKTIKHCFSLHRFGQKTLLGVYRWLILSFISYLLAYWLYLRREASPLGHLGNYDDLDWFDSAQQALVLLLPHILLLSLLNQLDIVIPWLNGLGFDFCLIRCKI
jgi:hypothetical protein